MLVLKCQMVHIGEIQKITWAVVVMAMQKKAIRILRWRIIPHKKWATNIQTSGFNYMPIPLMQMFPLQIFL